MCIWILTKYSFSQLGIHNSVFRNNNHFHQNYFYEHITVILYAKIFFTTFDMIDRRTDKVGDKNTISL